MKSKKEIADETLKIISDGYYMKNNVKVNVADLITKSTDNTFTVSPNDWEMMRLPDSETKYETEVIFRNCSTIQAIVQENNGLKTAVLNFASAKNPGGGFMGGASAQEESLARSSNLYVTLTKDTSMYNFNRNQRTFLYSDYMIYSPNVAFWFDDDGDFLAANYIVDVITSPAPNKGAMLQHNRNEELKQLNEVFEQRIDKVLKLASSQKVETLILGAWGCGVFRNDPKDVSSIFQKVIFEKYPHTFKKIVFAIYDRSKEKLVLKAFEKQFM